MRVSFSTFIYKSCGFRVKYDKANKLNLNFDKAVVIFRRLKHPPFRKDSTGDSESSK